MIRICFSPEESFDSDSAVPLFMVIPILPVSERPTVLLMNISLTMSL